MNTVNASTGYSPFQLQMGRSPRVIPPLVSPSDLPDAATTAIQPLLSELQNDVNDARDNLLEAKINNAFYTNHKRNADDQFQVGDLVMLSTSHRRREYTQHHLNCVAKFVPRFDGPYHVTGTHPETSSYRLHLPDRPDVFPSFHASQLRRHITNDVDLFPSRELPKPGPVLTESGMTEYHIEAIIDS